MTDEARTPEEQTSPHASSGAASPGADHPAPDEAVQAEIVEPGSETTADEPAELEALRAEAQARLDDARRIKAEFENYKKRILREQTSVVERAAAGLVDKMLPVVDAFRLALIAADRTKDYEALVRGVELVYGELVDVMHKEGLEEIQAEGKPFDPEVHEAVMEAEGGDPNGEPFVVDVLRPGYRFKGRVLRPAMVKVERR